MDSGLYELIREQPADAIAEAIVRRHAHASLPDYVRVVAGFGDIATCRLRVRDIERAHAEPSIVSLKAPRSIRSFDTPPTENAELSNEQYRGGREADTRGVVIGMIDFGFDVAHPGTLVRGGGRTTRILGLFDQRGPARGPSPNPYGYGAIHTQADINAALASDDVYGALGYDPADSDRGFGSHGCFTLDVAAGNGQVPGSPVGVAPGADIVCVHLATRSGLTTGRGDLGSSSRFLEGLDYIRRVAGERPWVVNASLGTTGGDHSGNSLTELAMTSLLSVPGRAVVQSAGNYFRSQTAANGVVSPGKPIELEWEIPEGDRTTNEVEIWHSGRDRFRIELIDPSGRMTFPTSVDEQTPVVIDGDTAGQLYYRSREPQTSDMHYDAFLFPAAPAGVWTIRIIGEQVVDGRFHAWIERDRGGMKYQSRFQGPHVSSRYTTGSIANGRWTLSTGAYDSGDPDRELAPFSSSGPTRFERMKPDLVAPGVGIRAARSTPRGEPAGSGGLTVMSGTSMAAPWVTGAIARLFARSPRPLTIEQTRRIVRDCVTPAPHLDADRRGCGYLDLEAIDAAAERLAAEGPPPQESTDMTTENRPAQLPGSNETSAEGDSLAEDTTTSNFVLVSGGPGPFDNRDVQHDVSWANYVTPPLLLTDTEKKKKRFSRKSEQIWWFVYKKAYEDRWTEDSTSRNANRRKAAEDVRNKGATSYVDLVEQRARQRGWQLRWLEDANDLWKRLATFRQPITRLWYWGHASDDLWLSLGHSSTGAAESPASDEIIEVSDISAHSALKARFASSSVTTRHRFIGCNTARFAKQWAKTFEVWTEGVDGYVHFCSLSGTGGEVCRFKSGSAHAEIRFYKPRGILDAGQSARITFPKCDTAAAGCGSAASSGSAAAESAAAGATDIPLSGYAQPLFRPAAEIAERLEEAEPDPVLVAIEQQLKLRIRSGDRRAISARRARLRELFTSVEASDIAFLYRRLRWPSRNDEFAKLFKRRLSTASRREMRCVLLRTLHRIPPGSALAAGSATRSLTARQACRVIAIAARLNREFARLQRKGRLASREAAEFGNWTAFLVRQAERLGRFAPATAPQQAAQREEARQLLRDAEKLLGLPAEIRRRAAIEPTARRLILGLRATPRRIDTGRNEAVLVEFTVGDVESLSGIVLRDETREGTTMREFRWSNPKPGYQSLIWDGTFRTRRTEPPEPGTYRVRLSAHDADGNRDSAVIDIEVSNTGLKKVFPRTGSGLRPATLHFDGSRLLLKDTRGNEIRMRAKSGRGDSGPIPAGNYTIKRIEEPRATRNGRLVYGSRSSTRIWGPRRLPLDGGPDSSRRKRYIHLDVGRDGTRGGIGVQPGHEGRFNQMVSLIGDSLRGVGAVAVVVEYPANDNGDDDERLPVEALAATTSGSGFRSIEAELLPAGEVVEAATLSESTTSPKLKVVTSPRPRIKDVVVDFRATNVARGTFTGKTSVLQPFIDNDIASGDSNWVQRLWVDLAKKYPTVPVTIEAIRLDDESLKPGGLNRAMLEIRLRQYLTLLHHSTGRKGNTSLARATRSRTKATWKNNWGSTPLRCDGRPASALRPRRTRSARIPISSMPVFRTRCAATSFPMTR